MPRPTEQLKEVNIEDVTAKTGIAIIDDDPGFSFMLKDYLLSSLQLKSDLFQTAMTSSKIIVQVTIEKSFSITNSQKVQTD